MTLNEFQTAALATAIYPNRGENIVYPVLGLVGEAGEVAEKVKKMIRDDGGVMTEERRHAIIRECGDALWYLAAISDELQITLDVVAGVVIKKLQDRAQQGKLKGDGDDREVK